MVAGDVPTSVLCRAPGPLAAEKAKLAALLHLGGSARMDGRIEGEVVAAAMVQIGETRRVWARVEAEEVGVAGGPESTAGRDFGPRNVLKFGSSM